MEDFSRELEKELKADFKPAPRKKIKKKRVLIIDDFGEIRSGAWLRTVNRLLLVMGIIFLFLSGVFYYLYDDFKIQNQEYEEKLAAVERRIDYLTAEKELFVAKLVILGEKPDQLVLEKPMQEKKQTEILQKKEGLTMLAEEPAEKQPESKPEAVTAGEAADTEIQGSAPGESGQPDSTAPEPVVTGQRTVDIENFQVSRDRQNEDLLVRFDIRNVSEHSGDVSGYIFTVLRTESQNTDNWLVVPTTDLKNGIPQIFKKGQYFSISRFKPVKFRIKKHSSPDVLTRASIFVFDNDGNLIFNSVIDITEDDKG